MNSKTIDMNTYPRRAHFDYFRSLQNPMLGVTVDVDVTALQAFCKAEGCSFYLAFMRCAAQAANGVPQLRQRIRDGDIVEYDVCGTSHVELRADGTYGYCTLHHDRPFREYLEYAEAERLRCREAASIEEDDDVEGLYFITSLPWLRYTQLIQPTAGGDESNPRISWGKYAEDCRGRLMMPVTLLANHALVDGLQVAQFYRNLDGEIADIILGIDRQHAP